MNTIHSVPDPFVTLQPIIKCRWSSQNSCLSHKVEIFLSTTSVTSRFHFFIGLYLCENTSVERLVGRTTHGVGRSQTSSFALTKVADLVLPKPGNGRYALGQTNANWQPFQVCSNSFGGFLSPHLCCLGIQVRFDHSYHFLSSFIHQKWPNSNVLSPQQPVRMLDIGNTRDLTLDTTLLFSR